LFDEATVDMANESVDAELDTQTVTYTRTKPKRKPLPKDLPRETIVIDIAESDKICASCQGECYRIGEDRFEKLDFIPAQLKVFDTVRHKYACRKCENAGTQNAIKQAAMPHSIIPKGIATPCLLSQIITGKFQYTLPLYR
jgi:transposase